MRTRLLGVVSARELTGQPEPRVSDREIESEGSQRPHDPPDAEEGIGGDEDQKGTEHGRIEQPDHDADQCPRFRELLACEQGFPPAACVKRVLEEEHASCVFSSSHWRLPPVRYIRTHLVSWCTVGVN